MKWNYRSPSFLKSRFGNFTKGNILHSNWSAVSRRYLPGSHEPNKRTYEYSCYHIHLKMSVQGDSLDLWERDYSTICRLGIYMAFLAEAPEQIEHLFFL